MAAADRQPIRVVSTILIPDNLSAICEQNIESPTDNKSATIMMVVNKENNSADLNTGVKGVRNLVDKDLTGNDSNSSEVGGFSPRPANLSGFNMVSNTISSKVSPSSPPLPNRIHISTAPKASAASPSSTMSSPASSIGSSTFPIQSPPLTTAPGGTLSGLNEASTGNKSPIGLNQHSAFKLASPTVVNGQKVEGAHLLSQHLLELNQMRPHGHQSPPYKFFQENAFYQSRQLLNGTDLSEFKLNVQLKDKHQREAFATGSETSEEVVVDGNDEGAEDSQHNAVRLKL